MASEAISGILSIQRFDDSVFIEFAGGQSALIPVSLLCSLCHQFNLLLPTDVAREMLGEMEEPRQ